MHRGKAFFKPDVIKSFTLSYQTHSEGIWTDIFILKYHWWFSFSVHHYLFLYKRDKFRYVVSFLFHTWWFVERLYHFLLLHRV